MDPVEEEEALADSFVTVAQMPSLGEVTLLHQSGKVRPKDMLDTVRMALDAGGLIHRMMLKSVTAGVEPIALGDDDDGSGTGRGGDGRGGEHGDGDHGDDFEDGDDDDAVDGSDAD